MSLTCSEQRIYRRVVAESLAYVSVNIYIAWSKDETSAQLEWVLAQLVLLVTGRFGTCSHRSVVTSKQMQKIRFLETRHSIRLPLFVDEQRKSDAGLFAEELCVGSIAQSHSRQIYSSFAEGLFVFAQLRHVLTAENSAVVA